MQLKKLIFVLGKGNDINYEKNKRKYRKSYKIYNYRW